VTLGAHAASSGGAAALRRLLDATDRAVAGLVILAMAAMTVTVAAQVFMRYALNLSLDWAEEVSRLFFVWAVFLAIPLGVKRGAHVGVALLTDRLPARVRGLLFRAMVALAALLMAVVVWEAAILTRDQWDEPMSTLDLSVGLFMLPVAVGAAHSILHLVAQTLGGAPVRRQVASE
jgi:TRAP-type C4-dicarboxylate transport system permease small subunit